MGEDPIRDGVVLEGSEQIILLGNLYSQNLSDCEGAARMDLPASRIPWLMLTDNPNSAKRTFFSIVDNSTCELEYSEVAQGKSCVGSSEGWLVIVDSNLDICLFNPFSRVQFQLPPLPTFEHLAREGPTTDMEFRRDCYIRKVFLSSSPLADDCVALAIYGCYRNLAFSRPGSNAWTNIESMEAPFQDATFFQGKFCVLSDRGTLMVCDLGPKPRVKVILCDPKTANIQKKKYIVNAHDMLFLVARIRTSKNEYYCTKGFKVFALIEYTNESGKLDLKWRRMRHLGSYSLFVGRNSSMCLSADEYPGCKRNCIYFTDDFYPYSLGGDSDMGMFNYGDGTIERPYPRMTQPDMWPPFWVKPN